MEMTNEILLQVISYQILITGFRNSFKIFTVDSQEAIENKLTIQFDKRLGSSIILSIVLLQIVNLVVIFGVTFKDLKQKWTNYKLKKAKA